MRCSAWRECPFPVQTGNSGKWSRSVEDGADFGWEVCEIPNPDDGWVRVASAGVLQLAEDLIDDGTLLIGQGCPVGEEEPHDSLIVGMDCCCDSACVARTAVLEEQFEALGLYVQHGGQDGIFVGTTPGLEKPTKADEMAFSGSQSQRLFVARALDGEQPLEHVDVAVHSGIGSEHCARGSTHLMEGMHTCEVIQECSLYYAVAEVWLSVHAIAEVVLSVT